MNNTTALSSFCPNPPDASGVLSWIHIGDLHMREQSQQNDLDLQAIVKRINAAFADSISFVFLPVTTLITATCPPMRSSVNLSIGSRFPGVRLSETTM